MEFESGKKQKFVSVRIPSVLVVFSVLQIEDIHLLVVHFEWRIE
jgi:hypothetical protein